MNLPTRLVLLLAIPLIVQIASLAALVKQEQDAFSAAKRVEHARDVVTAVKDFQVHLIEMLTLHADETNLAFDAAGVEHLSVQFRERQAEIDQIEQLSENDAEVRNLATRLRQNLTLVQNKYWQLINSYTLDGAQNKSIRVNNFTALRELIHSVLSTAKQIGLRETTLVDKERHQQDQTHSNITTLALSAGVAAALTTAVIAFHIMKSVAHRIAVLRQNAERFARGDKLEAPIQGADEIAILDREFHRMADTIRNASERERAIIENAQELICSLGENFVFHSANAAVDSFLGLLPRETVGRNFCDYIAPADSQRFQEFLEKVKEKSTAQMIEVELLHTNGVKVEAQLSAVWSSSERLYFCVTHNITAMRQAQRLRDEAVAMLNHDIRSPISSMQMLFARLLKHHDVQSNDELLKIAQNGMNNSERILQLTKSLLDLDKLRTGSMQLNKEPCHLAQIFVESCEVLEPLAKSKGVTLQPDITSIFVDADAELLQRVVVNILSNAIKFSAPSSIITITDQQDGDQALVAIHDQGPGIPKHRLATIFERYLQLDQEKNMSAVGSGLGLAICKSIVELHGGKIWAESKPGEGTTICFKIPLALEFFQDCKMGKNDQTS